MEHPIVIPPHIEVKLIDEAPRSRDGGAARERWLIQRAAQLGADQELEACCKWVDSPVDFEDYRPGEESKHLRAFRRPKPPSLKQQALEALDSASYQPGSDFKQIDSARSATIRRALESLPDDFTHWLPANALPLPSGEVEA